MFSLGLYKKKILVKLIKIARIYKNIIVVVPTQCLNIAAKNATLPAIFK